MVAGRYLFTTTEFRAVSEAVFASLERYGSVFGVEHLAIIASMRIMLSRSIAVRIIFLVRVCCFMVSSFHWLLLVCWCGFILSFLLTFRARARKPIYIFLYSINIK